MVARENQHILDIFSVDEIKVLSNRIGGATVPTGAELLLCWYTVDEVT
jgi:hypothetical protein